MKTLILLLAISITSYANDVKQPLTHIQDSDVAEAVYRPGDYVALVMPTSSFTSEEVDGLDMYLECSTPVSPSQVGFSTVIHLVDVEWSKNGDIHMKGLIPDTIASGVYTVRNIVFHWHTEDKAQTTVIWSPEDAEVDLQFTVRNVLMMPVKKQKDQKLKL